MLALVSDYLLQDGKAGLIAEGFELFAILGDVAALVDFETAERKIGPADSICQ